MTERKRTRRAWAIPMAVGLALAGFGLAGPAGPAGAHGSVTDPPTRNYGCLERWGDDHLNPAMAELDPMCWAAFQADPSAMWNWNGLYRENVGGRHEQVIPDGQLCSGGRTEGGRYAAMDTPGPWTAKQVPTNFTLTLTDGANHGADYLRIYVSKPGFDPTTQALGWGDLDLVKETGRYGPQSPYVTDVNLAGRSGRAVLFTIWQASHLDQPYYLCSDIIIGSGGTTPPPTTPPPTTPPPTTPPPTTPPPTTPPPTTEPPATGACTAAVTVVNSWPGGYQADVRVTAGSSAISGWSVNVSGASIDQLWGGSLSGSTISNAAWNGSLAAGASTSAGFIGSGSPGSLSATCTAG